MFAVQDEFRFLRSYFHCGFQNVDGITYVVSLHPDQLEDQSLGKGKGAELLKGISKRGDLVNGILDISKVVGEIADFADDEDAGIDQGVV